jgi:eukaryotic-like serine/threonine-protein kinase
VAEWKVPGFTEVKVLGSGGFGEVVLARHDATGTRVAIKYLHGELLADPGFAAMFRGEAEVLASVLDPNVVRLYEYVQAPGGAAIVMELVEGVCLREILARHGQTTPEAALVVLQGSLLGLAAAHARGVVHRDYKPENVLIDGAGASKLTDFGIAARAGDRPVPAGTLAYAPPEQFAGSPATPAGDVYAATATFYECLTGRPPFTGDSAERLLYQHLAEPVPLDPVPEPLRPLVAAGLAKDPAGRPADGAALVSELRTVAGRTYGPDWEDHGRSQLAAAALLLAALWPSGAAPAVQGATVHRVALRHRLLHAPRAAVKATVAGGVAVAVVVAVVAVAATHARPAGPAAPIRPAPTRSARPTPAGFTVSGSLTGVADTSASSAWAVGCAAAPTTAGGCAKVLIVRWNGATWTQVPSPDLGTALLISGVAAASASSAWAVGCASATPGPCAKTLILRWNGTTWTHVPSPSPGIGGWLMGVTATSADSAWAVGGTESSGGFVHPLILRWNGTTWTQVPGPSPAGSYLTGVAATSASSAWAVGRAASGPNRESTLILRWNGTAWTRAPSPDPGMDNYLYGVAATPAGTAWAVGYTGNGTSTSTSALILRWNGNTWMTVPNPGPAGSFLDGVAVTPASTAWAVGSIGNGISSSTGTLILRWNGTAWTRVPSPDPGPDTGLGGVVALSGSDAWAVGVADGETLILRWNGQMWAGPALQASPTAAPEPSTAPSAGSATAPAAVSSPALPPRQQAAQALAALLAQSGTDRAAVTQAVDAVAGCSAGLSQDEAIFSNAASSRQALLGQLAALPDRSALPAPVLQDLTAAWQASGQADQDFADWTQDEIAQGCSTNYQSNASFQAAMGPDEQATKDKKAFAALWTAIADEYGLPLYQYNQI